MNKLGDKKAILLSGGIDSTALAYWTKPDLAVTIDYGQKSALGEIRASAKVAEEMGIEHSILSIDCSSLGHGDLVGCQSAPESPASEWWPYRNQLLATLGVMWAYPLGVGELQIGSVHTDGFHRDGTKDFYGILSSVSEYQEGNIKITAPAIDLTTFELVVQSGIPRALLAWSHSCHKAEWACGCCRGCNKHVEFFSQLDHE